MKNIERKENINKESNNHTPIHLPPITTKKSALKNRNNLIELNTNNDHNKNLRNNYSNINTNKSQNQRTGLNEIKNRIINGNNNKKDANERYKNMLKNNSSGLIKTTPNNKSEKIILKNIKK